MNYKYGFTFSYPKKLFTIQNQKNNMVSWTTSGDFEELGPTFVKNNNLLLQFYTTEITSDSKPLKNFHRNYLTEKKKFLDNYKVNAQKIKNYDVDDVKGYIVLLYTNNKQEKDTSYINGYTATWLKDNVLYSLSLYTSQRDKTENQEKLFNDLLSTVKFTSN